MATESFFSNASLAYLASAGAGKDGKTYSIKPTDGTGDFTFSRGSNLTATRVGPTGLIEKGRENLLLQSNVFNTTPWGNTSIGFTSGQSGYEGSSDAWLIERIGVNSHIRQTPPLGNVMTFSIYAKANTLNWVRIRPGSVINAYFNLSTGSIGYTQNIIDATITDVGNGWYRCTATAIGYDRFFVYPAVNDQDTSGTTGSIYVQDAQVEVGLAATDYIESGATTGKAGLLENEPRFDYSGGATCPSLLLEPQRVNLIRYSEYYGSNLFVNSSPEINNTTSPEGVQNATLLKEDTNSGNHAMREPSNTSIAADDSQYVISFFAKSNGRNIRFIDDGYAGSGSIVNFNLSSGGTFNNGFLVIDSDAVAIGTDGWYRCYAVIDKVGAVQSGFRFSLRLLGGASNDNDSYTGDGTSGVWIYGKEVNDSVSYPTSYIPNHSGGSATRTADDATNTGTIDADNDFTLFIETTPLSQEVDVPKYFNSSGYGYLNHNATGYLRYRFGSNYIFSLDGLNTFKFALKYDGTNLYTFYNGVKVHTIAASLSGIQDIDFEGGKHKQFLIFPEALSDADCISLTTL